MSRCKTCGRELSPNDVGLTKKLINRGADEFYCINCLASAFRCDVSVLEEKIEHFRAQGCTLFI